jgi:hypothetical protein
LLLVFGPTARAAPDDAKPAPQKLWEAFPLNPTGERVERSQQPGPFTPPKKPTTKRPTTKQPTTKQPTAQEPTTTSPQEETQAVAEIADSASGTKFVLFVLAASLLLFVAAVVSVLLRAGHTRVHPATFVGTAGLDAGSDATRHRPGGIFDRARPRLKPTRPRVTRRRGARRVAVRGVLHRRSRVRNLGLPARRIRDVVLTEDTAPAIVGAGIAVVLAILIIQFVG